MWRNGLVWGEADLGAQKVHLQPWRWTPDHQAWALAADAFAEAHRGGDWWVYRMPGTETTKHSGKSSPASPAVPPPQGWNVTGHDKLARHLRPLDEGAAVRFFNGAVPGWHWALSSSIPRREVVGTLAARFRDADSAGQPIIVLLLAAGCEGKTTALLQTAHEVVKEKPEWRILHRANDAEPLNPTEILPVLSGQHRWLLVIDEADRVARNILALVQQLPPELQARIHFLIACRDSDWQASGAYGLNWSSASAFHLESLAGLNREDAEAIVGAWAAFGNAGLGDLAKAPEEERVDILEQQAREEAKTAHGAFFGALLAVRHGSDLRNHARLMLERLGQRRIPGGKTLRDAFAFIAAMHAEELEFLSRPVLAYALGCPLEKLHRKVVSPLGQEAAATTTSSFVFTRHRRVAQAVISVLEQQFGEDIAGDFLRLGEAAIEALQDGHYVPVVSAWRYDLPQHFFETGRTDLALSIAEGVLSREPQNYMTLVNVAHLYRKAGAPDQAVELFRDFHKTGKLDRRFYNEWSVCEGESGDQVSSVLLAAFSLSDARTIDRVDNEDAKMALAGLGVALGRLFADYREVTFRDARASVAVLGQQLELDQQTSGYFQNHLAEAAAAGAKVPTVQEAFDLFRRGVIAAQGFGANDPVISILPDAASITFKGLERLIDASIEANKSGHEEESGQENVSG